MSDEITYRCATAADEHDCFVLLRRSLHDGMVRNGYVAHDAPEPDLDAAWKRQASLFAHLTASCAQWWLAEQAPAYAFDPNAHVPFNPCLFL